MSKIEYSKKSIIDEILKYEMGCFRADEPYIADALLQLGMITSTGLSYTTESDAWYWYENKPSEKDKLKVLRTMGYDLSILK